MKASSAERIRDFLRSNRLAALATISAHHTPHVSYVYYMYDGGKVLYVAIPKNSHNSENIALHPDVSLAIAREDSSETLLVDAHASIVDEKADRSEMLLEMFRALREIQNKSFTWPLLKMHGVNIEIIKIEIGHFRHWIFKDEVEMTEGEGSDLNES